MCNYIITEEEIKNAEKEIFEHGEQFNDEQRIFLKCLDSCCVQAYAGTGKTSTLIGKLHTLSQKEVWKNGRGICVLSHTNVAVDEIKKRVAKTFPAILEYPNFVGTIQEFVNKFLFIPALSDKTQRMKFQDSTRYYDRGLLNNELRIRIENHLNSKIRHSVNSKDREKQFFKKLSSIYCYEGQLYSVGSGDGDVLFTDLVTKNFPMNKVVSGFKDYFDKKHELGQFLFVESFAISCEYLTKYPIVSEVISQRFQFVFLDEAQDCSKVQISILERLFKNESTVFQQIGDENQAISAMEWSATPESINLSKSTRFGNGLADFVNHFQVSNGEGVTGNQSETLRHLIKYDIGKENDVLDRFASKIKEGNISIEKDVFVLSERHEDLEKMFVDIYRDNSIEKKRNSFKYDIDSINGLTRETVLKNGSNVVFTNLMGLLYKYLKGNIGSRGQLKEWLINKGVIPAFLVYVFNLSRDILRVGKVVDLDNMRDYLNSIIGDECVDFSENDDSAQVDEIGKFSNRYVLDDICVNIGTIHSVKGQTHSATLLFSSEGWGKNMMEHVFSNTRVYTPKYKRLLYVAASRPKYLFALAIEKTVFEKLSLVEKEVFKDFSCEEV